MIVKRPPAAYNKLNFQHFVDSNGRLDPNVLMQLFAHNDEVEKLEAALAAAGQARGIGLLLPLAWQLRQRNTKRALELSDEVERALESGALSGSDRQSVVARLQLIRAEVALLSGNLEQAAAQAALAQAHFVATGDAIGTGDAHWFGTFLAIDLGDTKRSANEADLAKAAYATTTDTQRQQMATARRVLINVFIDFAATPDMLVATGLARQQLCDPTVSVWIASTNALIAQLSTQYATSVQCWEQAFAMAVSTGQMRQALFAASNISAVFIDLGNLDAALDWPERGLSAARTAGLQVATGHMLARIGDVLRLLGHNASARNHLLDALETLQPVKSSNQYAAAVLALARVLLALNHGEQALDRFLQAEASTRAMGMKQLLASALRGRASALVKMNRPGEALSVAHEALALSIEQGQRVQQSEALQIIADVHRRFQLPAPAGLKAPSAALHYLDEALAAAASVEDYAVPHTLLEEAAAEHAKLGELAIAYRLALQAGISRERVHNKDASNRVVALQVRHETERTRAEAEFQKQLALSEAQRASVLQGAIATLENLGEIGRDITANLSMMSVFDALDRHVHRLLDATTFAIYLINDAGDGLESVLNVEAGKHLPVHRIATGDINSYVARCAQARTEIVLALEAGVAAAGPSRIPGTLPTMSLMYAPLLAGERLLGVMTIQSPQAHAYGERETAIFRTLCSYGAIALANGHAYDAAENARQLAEQARSEAAAALEELSRVQAQLVEKNRELEMLSTTDRLTGLSNRLRIEVALQQELARCERHQRCFSLILLDIDKFKVVNDTHGHHIGDTVLIEVARVLGESVRKTDLVGRWGGEEFLIVCIDTASEAAAVLAEKIRAALEAHDIAITGPKTGSFGVSSYRAGDDIKTLMIRADAALYRAKEAGRNRVELG